MKRPAIVAAVAMVAFVAAVGLIKLLQIRAAVAQGSFTPPPTAVTTAIAEREEWPIELRAVGSVVAVQGVTVSADLPGVVAAIRFESGERVRKGELLVQLDTKQEQAQLESARAEERLAASNLARGGPLFEHGVITREAYDALRADSSRTSARLAEVEAVIERKRIRAPFAGVLGIRRVNLGQVLGVGAPVVGLETIDPVFVRFSVPQQDYGALHVGADVRAVPDPWKKTELSGRITALDAAVDQATRNVEVQATFANPDAVLRSGMFVDVRVLVGATREVIALPATAISHAPYGDSVFVVEDMVGPEGTSYRGVRQQFVELGPARGDQVAVVSGVEPGAEVVSSGVFRLRAGAAVQVDNSVQPSADPAPTPEER